MNVVSRPDPDQLLQSVNAEAARAHRGRLRIFFGATAGVGKTYAMLQAARDVRANGIDLVIGYVELHGRADTERLLEGLEQLPTLAVRYRDIVRREFDLDAGLKRHPAILVVDELAHSNLIEGDPPPRHAKRWQDVEELLEQGISVWTTLNVQHLESLNDLVAQITGIRQRETLPDRIFEEAEEVELIDLPAEDLLQRLAAGKIYVPEQIATASERFFRKTNLLALRELALRRVADRVDASARADQLTDRTSRAWMARDRLLVAIGPDAQAEQLVRAGKRLAAALDASWSVVYVETPELMRLSTTERNRRIELLRLAESLGAETVTLDGPSAAQALIEYAQLRNITRLIIGRPKRTGWRRWLRASTTTEVLRRAGELDVVTIGLPEELRLSMPRAITATPDEQVTIKWNLYFRAFATTLVSTAVAFVMYPYFELANIVMAYVLGATFAGIRLGRGPAVLTAVANVLAFDFCFVPPRFTFSVADAQYLITFAVMLVVTLVTANLMASVRQQNRVAGARERRTAALYSMSRELAATRGVDNMAAVAVRHVAEVFDCKACVLLPDPHGRLRYPNQPPTTAALRGADLAIAQWVLDHGKRAGLGCDTLPAAPVLYVPLSDETARRGVLAVLPANRRRILLPEQRHLLETFAGQLGLAMERAQLAEKAEVARVTAETESLRNTLLASISHDLRTPLAVIAGASSTLAERGHVLDDATRASLAHSIAAKSREMANLISNVLDLMRFESGQIAVHRDWQTLDELLGIALQRLEEPLRSHPVSVNVPTDLPPVHVDAQLVVQVLVNLLDNITKYTPPTSSVHIFADADEDFVHVTLDDDGPGLPGDDPERLFEKFQRGRKEDTVGGAGLGLAICRAIIRAHGGEIHASHRPGGGARFRFMLPTKEPPS